MYKFLYVHNSESRDKLLAIGYHLIKSDETHSTYIFENQENMKFSLKDIDVVPSNTLTYFIPS